MPRHLQPQTTELAPEGRWAGTGRQMSDWDLLPLGPGWQSTTEHKPETAGVAQALGCKHQVCTSVQEQGGVLGSGMPQASYGMSLIEIIVGFPWQGLR